MLVLPLAHAQQAQRSGRVAAGHPGALPHRAASATPPPPGNSTAAAASGPGAAPAPAPAPAIALFVGVLSAPGNRTARDAIRATWGADARLARVLFVALGGHTAPEQVALLAEAARHRDMVVVSDVPNSYHNPTHALVALFRAAAAAADRATHVLKTDDDSYVRVPALLDTLAALPRTWLYAGRVERTPVRRRPGDRWEVPRANWPSDAPITYTWGMASILSMDLVTLLAAGGVHLSMPPANMLWIEDMAVGVWVADLARVRGVAVKVRPLASISAERCRDRDVVTANLPHPVGPSMRCLHALGGRCCSANLTALCCS
jgi:predicted DCC family thiol-disulfide oxidoreductase YuxK